MVKSTHQSHAPSTTDDHAVPNKILFPVRTEDYYVQKGRHGLGLFAARNFKKGQAVFSESLEYMYADVNEGDTIIFTDGAIKSDYLKRPHGIPDSIPSTREMLEHTHGVEYLLPDSTKKFAGIGMTVLEVPGMLMNHSCEPNVVSPNGIGGGDDGIAARDIKKGEELTDNYFLHEDSEGFSFECDCGASNCKRNGGEIFENLSDAEKEMKLPFVSAIMRAEYKAKTGRGPPVKWTEPTFPQRISSGVPRVVFPGPGSAGADVLVKQRDDGTFATHAARDFAAGERVYYYWQENWPMLSDSGDPIPVDLVFACPDGKNDPLEGTVVHIDSNEVAATKDKNGKLLFSGWHMLVKHSCDPNLIICGRGEDDYSNWRSTYAMKDIRQGEMLTTDYNCLLWDRSDSQNSGHCTCGSVKCVGTMKGFAYLSRAQQEERKLWTWKQNAKIGMNTQLGKALSSHVREQWRKMEEDVLSSSSSSSSSDGESSSDDESSAGST